MYSVEIEVFRKDKITSYTCSCPYNGNICKHVVAVLFLLREKWTNVIGAQKSLLESSRKSRQSDAGAQYAELLKSLIRNYSQGKFIDYKSVPGLAGEVNELLGESHDLIQKGDFRNAFLVVKSVLAETIGLIAYCDDSSGYIQDFIYSAIELMGVIAGMERVAPDLLGEMFDFAQSALKRPIYFDYGNFGYEIVKVQQSLALKLNKEKTFLSFIDKQIKTASEKDSSFRKDYFITQKITFLRIIGRADEAQQLLLENIDIVEVRQGEVSRLAAAKEFSAAKQLIAAGIDIARRKKLPGVVFQWEKELLCIAILENDQKLVRHYTRYFAFNDGFHAAYYHQWKNTFTETEWVREIETFIEKRIERVELQYQKDKGHAWYSLDISLLDLLGPIYVEEKYWDRLLALMSKVTDLQRLLRYHDYLVKVCPLQLLTIYLPAFEREGDVVANRSQYRHLAANVEMVIKAIPEGRDEMIAVVEEINRKHPRRTAMITELNRVVKNGGSRGG
ncbi:SWIM zinc finger family protein [Chitinophaga polysaccharea]|uniref:SWIM zinc finger family protein n=1 Tax=Chitinophaga polysaccharea TaxID=1293035 RepID=UPI001455D97E|nr:SWIM zinc finger family protein [Chitinophaga polysaccharea]NLR56966.1 SWIM zinc finger family protein [Chitinophaga polysaccharea]